MKNVLVIDHETEFRNFVSGLLGWEYNILEADCDSTAIDMMCENDSIDLVLLSAHMPGVNGWETRRVIMDKDNGWPDVPVIMMIEYPEDALKAWCGSSMPYVGRNLSFDNGILEVVNQLLDVTDFPPLASP